LPNRRNRRARNTSDFDKQTAALESYDGVFLTSAAAAEFFAESCAKGKTVTAEKFTFWADAVLIY
jgi:uroporphyrinogen-III synthase